MKTNISHFKAAWFVLVAILLNACTTSLPLNTPPTEQNDAIVSLLERAHKASAYGEYEKSKSLLERALRLEAKNAQVWLELAKVNKRQGNVQQAQGLALRAKSFAGDNPWLRRKIESFINSL